MKRYLLIFLLCSFVFVGCTKKNSMFDVNAITDLVVLQEAVSQISEDVVQRNISLEQAQNIVNQLQQKYLELTDVAHQNIETQFENIQKNFSQQGGMLYSIPLRARRLGISEPKGMKINKALSKPTYINNEGYSSTILVYTGDFTVAMEQADILAKQANLFVSKEFEKAQALAQSGDTRYISGLDTDALMKGIVYTNHELLDMNVDTLLSISVDQDGTLIIEATKYK